MSPELLKKILDAIAGGDEKAQAALLPEIVAAMAGAEGAEDAPAVDPMAAAADSPAEDPNAPAVAASKELSPIAKALGCATEEEAAQAVLKLQKQVNEHAAASAAVELETRRGLVTELVKLGVEFPATAWKGKPEDRIPADRLAAEPIADLRARVELHKAAGPRVPAEAPPTGSTEIKLSKVEQGYCTKHGLTPEQFQARKASVARTAK